MDWRWLLVHVNCYVVCTAKPEKLVDITSCSSTTRSEIISDDDAWPECLVSEQQALLQAGGVRLAKVKQHGAYGLRSNEVSAGEGVTDDGTAVVVMCETTRGALQIVVNRTESPNGADRFLAMVKDGFFTDLAIFRVVPQMFAQFGISGLQNLNDKWQGTIPDDKQYASTAFPKGTISFAGNGVDSRNTQLFISLADGVIKGTNPWETPVGHVVNNLEVLDQLYSGYGDGPPWGQGPEQALIYDEGNSYLQRNFSKLDYFSSCNSVK